MDDAARKADIAARLAAMQNAAAALNADRGARLQESDRQDAEELAKEEERRRKDRGVGPSFMAAQQKAVYGGAMDLSERMRRAGGVGMVGDNN